jgi:hypothetical protein
MAGLKHALKSSGVMVIATRAYSRRHSITPMGSTESHVDFEQTGSTPPSIAAQRNSELFHCSAG